MESKGEFGFGGGAKGSGLGAKGAKGSKDAYDADEKERLLHAISRPYGMVLVTGPTES